MDSALHDLSDIIDDDLSDVIDDDLSDLIDDDLFVYNDAPEIVPGNLIILVTFWSHFGHILVTFWSHFGHILVTF